MPYIKTIDENNAAGNLKETYEKIAGKGQRMAHVLKIQSLNPPAMKTHYDFYRTIMFGKSSLSRAQREMIATVVSVHNCCHYWITHHGAALLKTVKNKKIVADIKRDFRTADITAAEKAMLEYAIKLTTQTCSVSGDDVKPLRKAGFGDEAILDIVQIISYFNFVNRLACGLGIELEDFYDFGGLHGIDK